jgi:hypothetical protein
MGWAWIKPFPYPGFHNVGEFFRGAVFPYIVPSTKNKLQCATATQRIGRAGNVGYRDNPID